MKIALIGSAPSSVRLAPYSDTSWKIWGCSPAVYPVLPRCDKFFELHRWEPGVIGRPETQKPWFSPEYCAWMAKQSCVVMTEPVPDIPGGIRLPQEYLRRKYGDYNFTSTLAWMFACAIEEILERRVNLLRDAATGEVVAEEDAIGLWGVDMAANEEWGYQRAGCQFFIQIAQQKGIRVEVPPESDLLMPPALYGVVEHSRIHIKLLARLRELQGRLAGEEQALEAHKHNVAFLKGAIDDLTYQMNTWSGDGEVHGAHFTEIFREPDPSADQAVPS